ncbi:MAG: polyprenyl synthetase family protein [Tannerella sp.]|jgi:octaprenyl-diphosphate synthase|nr:polyprenyl synthetase family protein [Tannerella sp.]
MIDRSQIAKPVASEFKQFEADFARVLHSETPLLQSAIEQVLCSNGKHVRPLLLLLTAKVCGELTKTTQDAAVIIETLHTTTLIHDDVVDETKQRRGIPSLNAIFDNRIAVLTGDYMLAGTILNAAETGNIVIIKIIAKVCRELSEGELIQIDNAEKHSLNEDEYLHMIRKKTATLISACSEIGAISVNAPSEIVHKCRLFGEYLGFCFQIKDDIFDYYDDVNIGKPTGNDIREGKITLPLLYALKNAPEKEKHAHLEVINNQNFTPENVITLINFAKQHNGIEYAEKRLLEYKQKAVEIINSFPESEARNSLLMLADYFSERTN